MEQEEFLQVYRHSLSHILAKAVIEIYGKDVQYAIGPQIEDGFYYDFVLPEGKSIQESDLKGIENKMHEILKRKENWTRKEVSKQEALDIFKDQKFKTELIEDLPADEKISIYYTGDDYVDLCRGPHVENSQELMSSAFELRSVSGSYWRGDEHKDSMTRVYAYAFPDKAQLKAHKDLIREAKERDHKVIGKQLELFHFEPSAPGMAYWLPRGWKMYNALLDFWRNIHDEHGYQEVSGPVLSKKELWVTSGHWAHYQDGMFILPAEDDADVMALKPMNCPNAIKVYQTKSRSYKDLPLRYNQVDVIHRKEKSGELNGLFRVQEFRQDDAHTLVTEDQIAPEIADIMKIADEIYSTFGLTYGAELSTRPADFMGDINSWNKAEEDLKKILVNQYGEGGFEVNEGDGAFYGPKIDLKMKDALGREWQMGTIQLDFQLPLNFDMKYTAADGTQKQPVMIHRAIFGSFERFIGIITENFKGEFPFWMSPYQIGIVPIRAEHNEYAKHVADLCRKNGLRVEANYDDDNMKTKIKAFKNYKDPYILVLGDKEAEEHTVSINIRGNKQLNGVPLDKFLDMCDQMNEEHSLEILDTVD
ncbi:MAG: threonine--tRNA ligase [Lachnospiraceae bacterium]|nr:threonine--tRNA ligase [Lachnospiraceae bacterium]